MTRNEHAVSAAFQTLVIPEIKTGKNKSKRKKLPKALSGHEALEMFKQKEEEKIEEERKKKERAEKRIENKQKRKKKERAEERKRIREEKEQSKRALKRSCKKLFDMDSEEEFLEDFESDADSHFYPGFLQIREYPGLGGETDTDKASNCQNKHLCTYVRSAQPPVISNGRVATGSTTSPVEPALPDNKPTGPAPQTRTKQAIRNVARHRRTVSQPSIDLKKLAGNSKRQATTPPQEQRRTKATKVKLPRLPAINDKPSKGSDDPVHSRNIYDVLADDSEFGDSTSTIAKQPTVSSPVSPTNYPQGAS
ncbi:putative uncharacterized protein DDB_G0271982 [Argopecten irradians]|uniref:putative uncharacterized protein DDB_G0271982 n=1 Tax=Argopecten irradians TaxID=31199 RepID=UPI003714A0CF